MDETFAKPAPIRLLHVVRLEFEAFDLADAPAYVIASHTWDLNGETTFDAFQNRQGQAKPGFQKVLDLARFVREKISGIEWLWIDTCCIDKRDDIEVTRSINSMFRWYLHAALCLAYLSDVPSAADTTSFAKCKWFKRGWTLQELLAARAVVFLTSQWDIIGHKADSAMESKTSFLAMGALLNCTVAWITKIPETVLADFYCSRLVSVEERLRWIEERITTEPEDMSYSLLGIFDVRLSVKYGEGEHRARERLLSRIKQNAATLARLSAVDAAAFNSRENVNIDACLENTRVDLLKGIYQWASFESGPCVYSLSGMAGTGKSTIFKSVAQTLDMQHRLAASFCFKRGDADRESVSSLFSTLSLQLAQRLPDVSAAVVSALELQPDLLRKSLRHQFQKLILEPLKEFASAPVSGPAWIICVDAVDECDSEADISLAIILLARLAELKSANFRLFFTGRPDLAFRSGTSQLLREHHIPARLEDITRDVVEHDIAIFLEYRLAQIRTAYNNLNGANAICQDWPGEDAMRNLLQMAQPLFIFAATACRLLSDPEEDPQETLRDILEYRSESSLLGRTYLPVLSRLLTDKSEDQRGLVVRDFQSIVGSIVCLLQPLSIAVLANLLDLKQEKVRAKLQRLHSVLEVSNHQDSASPVRLLHLSFRNFLTNSQTRGQTPFWIDERKQHQALALSCIRLLRESEGLREDVCSVIHPGTQRSSIDVQHVRNSIRPEVAYACRFWVGHVSSSRTEILDNEEVHHFLQAHLLHWLEALSWLGVISDAISLLESLQSRAKNSRGSGVRAFLEDALRFVLKNRRIMDICPLQVYASALIFAPMRSLVRCQFDKHIPRWLRQRSTVDLTWGAERLVIEKSRGNVKFFPDGQMIAVGSFGMIRTFRTGSGQEINNMNCHFDKVTALDISPDGSLLISGSEDGTLRLWNVHNENEIWRSDKHIDQIHSVAFSPDGALIASGQRDVMIWEASTGRQSYPLGKEVPYPHHMQTVAFSPDGSNIICRSTQDIVSLRDTVTGGEVCSLQAHTHLQKNRNMFLAISRDAQFLATSVDGKTASIWNFVSGAEVRRFDFDRPDRGMVSLSPDGMTLATGSVQGKVEVYDILTGQTRQLHEAMGSLCAGFDFSPDGLQLVARFGDGTVRLWDLRHCEPALPVDRFGDPVLASDISRDEKTVVTLHTSGLVQLWDAYSGRAMSTADVGPSYRRLAISADGHIVACESLLDIALWDGLTDSRLRTVDTLPSGVWKWKLSYPDGKLLWVKMYSGLAWLIDTLNGEKVMELGDDENYIADLSVSSNDSNLLLTVGSREFWLYNVRSRQLICKLAIGCRFIDFLDSCPDGHLSTPSGFEDSTAVWNFVGEKSISGLACGFRMRMQLQLDVDGNALVTEQGALDTRNQALRISDVLVPQPSISTLDIFDEFIRYLGLDLLWLPPELRYQYHLALVRDNLIVIPEQSGAVVFLKFDMEHLRQLYHI